MNWDESFFLAVNGLAGRSAAFDWLMVELAKPGNLLYPIIIAAGYWLWTNRRECVIGSVILAGVVGATDALGTQLKGLVQRPRPCLTLPEVQTLLGCGGAFSFPFQPCGEHGGGGGLLSHPLSTIRLDQLAPGVGDRSVPSVLHRSPLPDGCDRRVDGGRIDRSWRGLAASSLVSFSSGSCRDCGQTRPSGSCGIGFFTRLIGEAGEQGLAAEFLIKVASDQHDDMIGFVE